MPYQIDEKELDRVTDAFIACAVELEDVSSGDETWITKETKDKARAFCRAFVEASGDLFRKAVESPRYNPGRFGADIYLTCSGSGAGFFDRDELRDGDIGDKLTDIADGFYLEAYCVENYLCILCGVKDDAGHVAYING